VAKDTLYTGSSDHTARSWVIEFGDCARIFRGHEHTVGCIKYHKGLGASYCCLSDRPILCNPPMGVPHYVLHPVCLSVRPVHSISSKYEAV